MKQSIDQNHYQEINNKAAYEDWFSRQGYEPHSLTIGQVIHCIIDNNKYLEVKQYIDGWNVLDYSKPQYRSRDVSEFQSELIDALWVMVKEIYS